MERKIGEIFEYNGEWYQCVKSPDGSCKHCDMNFGGKCPIPIKECVASSRSDLYYVIFKKLEKVGEPYSCNYYGDNRLIMMQEYNLFNLDDVTNEDKIPMYITDYKHKRIAIEIKQTKEDMEDLDKIKVRDYTKVEELNVMEEKKLNLKPFDIQKAREGKPVCTRGGRKARIICFDYNGETGDYPIVALVHYNKGNKCYERVLKYTSDGLFNKYRDCQHDDDLMMLPEKKEGWVNIYKSDNGTYYTGAIFYEKNDALVNTAEIEITTGIPRDCIDTVKISWEE